MRSIAVTAIALSAAALASSPSPGTGQDPMPACDTPGFTFGAGPALIADNEGDNSISARIRLAGCATGHTQITGRVDEPNGFPMSWVLLTTGRYLWAGGSVASAETNEVRAGAGLSISLSMPDRVAPIDVLPPCLPFYDGGGFYWGFVEVTGTGAYQENVDRSESMLTGGAELRYARTGTRWARLVPSLVLRAEAVEPIRSEARAALGIPDEEDGHNRVQARTYWYAPLPGRLTLQAEAEAFRTSGLEDTLAVLGWTGGKRAAATLRWGRRLPIGNVLNVGSAWARYAYGQEPTTPDNQHVFTAGFSIGFSRGGGADRGLAGAPEGPTLSEPHPGSAPASCRLGERRASP